MASRELSHEPTPCPYRKPIPTAIVVVLDVLIEDLAQVRRVVLHEMIRGPTG